MYSKGIPRASNEYIYSYVPLKTSISGFLCNHEHISVSILFIPVHRWKTPSFGSFTIEDIACTLELCQFRIVLLLSHQAVVAMRMPLLVTYFGIFFCHHIALLMCVEIDLILIQPPWKLFVFALDTFDVIVSQLTLSIVRYVTFKGQTCMKWAYLFLFIFTSHDLLDLWCAVAASLRSRWITACVSFAHPQAPADCFWSIEYGKPSILLDFPWWSHNHQRLWTSNFQDVSIWMTASWFFASSRSSPWLPTTKVTQNPSNLCKISISCTDLTGSAVNRGFRLACEWLK